jgi:hypothetical protein
MAAAAILDIAKFSFCHFLLVKPRITESPRNFEFDRPACSTVIAFYMSIWSRKLESPPFLEYAVITESKLYDRVVEKHTLTPRRVV